MGSEKLKMKLSMIWLCKLCINLEVFEVSIKKKSHLQIRTLKTDYLPYLTLSGNKINQILGINSDFLIYKAAYTFKAIFLSIEPKRVE